VENDNGAVRRLPREQPWKAEVGCGFLAGLIPAMVGGFIIYMEHTHPGSNRNAWVAAVVGWGFLATGVVMLLAIAYNFMATMNPETIVSVDKNPIARGDTLTIHLEQPGPVRLESLRADLFGEKLFVPMHFNAPGDRRTVVDRKHLGTFKFFDRENFNVRRGEVFTATATLVIPPEIQRSSKEVNHTSTTWRIEVWGSVRNGFNFRHPFVVEII
jgi:hypothetical protein